ncbi:MAG: hypothetical protein ACRD2C_26025, partial [Acidimicrobiales bacterium]
MEATTGQPTPIDEVRRQADVLGGVVASLLPDAVPVSGVVGLWEAFGRVGRLAVAGQLLLARRLEEAPDWSAAGCRSAAELMARRSGRSVRVEREAIRTSKKLGTCPTVEAAVRGGGLSEQRTGLVAGAGSVDPSRQDELIELATRLSLVELAQECGRVKAAADPDPEATYRRIRENRRLRQRTDGEGAWCLSGRSTADDGALVNHALGPLIDEQYKLARAEGRHEHRDAYAWDAFIELVRRYLDADDLDDLVADDDRSDANPHHHSTPTPDPTGSTEPDRDDTNPDAAGHAGPNRDDHEPNTGCSGSEQGEPTPAATGRGDSGSDPVGSGGPASPNRRTRRHNAKAKRKRSRVKPRHLALLRVDLRALVRGGIGEGELCELGGAPIPVGVARRVLGDSILKLVITRGVDVVSVTHLGRGPTAAQRVALLWQRPLCSNEVCGHGWVENDHREDWAKTHVTRLAALDPLCPHCHRLKTHHRWAL